MTHQEYAVTITARLIVRHVDEENAAEWARNWMRRLGHSMQEQGRENVESVAVSDVQEILERPIPFIIDEQPT